MPPPLVYPSSATANGVTRLTYRRRLIPELGKFAFGSVTTLASGLEAERYVISSNVRADQRGRDYYDGLYCYVSVGPTQRKLVNGGYEGSRGVLAADEPFDDPLPTGTTFELSVLPAEAYGEASGLNDIINLALESLPIIDWVPVTLVANQTQYSFANYTWPIKGIHGVAYPRTSATADQRLAVPQGSWYFDQDGEGPALSFTSLPAAAGTSIEVALLRPASTRIRQSGAWGNSATGLASDADEALYDAATVVRAAKPIALERLAKLYERGSKERADILGESEEAWVRAAFSRFYGAFRGSGVQRVGSSGGGRSWAKNWRP